MTYFTNNIKKEELDLIYDTFFKGNPVSLKEDLSGQSLENDNFVLGCTAGPDCNVEYLLHEMAHLAELEKNRLLQKPYSGWGFGWGDYWEIGTHSGYEPKTDQSTRREIRAWSYQYAIMRKFNIGDLDLINLVKSAVYLDSFSIYKYKVLSETKIDELGYRESEIETIKIIANEVEKLSNTDYSFDKFIKAWNERMDILT